MSSTRERSGAQTSEDVIRALDDAGHRVTPARRAVVDLIFTRNGAFDTSDLVADARRRKLGAARATIFRTLELLNEIGAVERLDLPNGEHTYIRCSSGHHHHVVCTRCQRSVDLEDCGMGEIAEDIGRRTGYQIDRHRIELFGLCPSCQRQAEA